MGLQPNVYLTGGYQSPGIILTDVSNVVNGMSNGIDIPLGGQPGGPWNTLLKPNTDYLFSVILNFTGFSAAGNVTVRFWTFDGGIGIGGTLLEEQQVSIPPALPFSGSMIVVCGKKFHSAMLGMHKCAVVSISNLIFPGGSDNFNCPDTGHDPSLVA